MRITYNDINGKSQTLDVSLIRFDHGNCICEFNTHIGNHYHNGYFYIAISMIIQIEAI